MLLSDKDIIKNIKNKRLKVQPFDLSMLQPSSIDLSLDNKFRVFKKKIKYIDPSILSSNYTFLVENKKNTPFILYPKEFILGCTYEKISIPNNLAARLEGKSSLGRIGLFTHSTAGFIDPGFCGHITLELMNASPIAIKLWYKLKIGQICFFSLSSAVNYSYGSKFYKNKYQNQVGPTESRFHIDR